MKLFLLLLTLSVYQVVAFHHPHPECAKGIKGPPGRPGYPGLRSRYAMPGSKGDVGPPGPNGQPGMRGTPVLYCDHDNHDEEMIELMLAGLEEKLLLLEPNLDCTGEKGDKGRDGADGYPAPPGPTGIPGDRGNPGCSGMPGRDAEPVHDECHVDADSAQERLEKMKERIAALENRNPYF